MAPPNSCPTPGSGSCTAAAITPISTSAALNGTFSAGSGTFSADGSGVATFDSLKAAVLRVDSDATSPSYEEVVAGVESTDSITINFGALTGQSGLLIVDYLLDGDVVKNGSFNAGLAIIAQLGALTQVAVYDESTSGEHSFPVAIPFTYGTSFNMSFELLAAAGTFDITRTGDFTVPPGSLDNTTPQYTVSAGSGSADFADTFQISGLQVFDANMNPVSGATFTSGSGTQYAQNGVVPEPASGALFLAVLLSSFIYITWIIRKDRSISLLKRPIDISGTKLPILVEGFGTRAALSLDERESAR